MSQFSMVAKPEFVVGPFSDLCPDQWSLVSFGRLE